MATKAQNDRSIAAAEKQLAKAKTDQEKAQAKFNTASKAVVQLQRRIDWLRDAPVDDDTDETEIDDIGGEPADDDPLPGT